MPVNFAPLIDALYAQLDAARASITDVDADVPSLRLRALLHRYDEARAQAPPPVVDANDPTSVSAMCDTLKPLYEAHGAFDRVLVSWMGGQPQGYDGPMLNLVVDGPFESFFRKIFEQVHLDQHSLVQAAMDRIFLYGDDPWQTISRL